MPMTLVSVVIPAYNAAQYLGEALESCLAQTYPAVETIVVDDGSTDETAQVVTRYPQVRYFRQPNGGVSRARNCGVRHANGEFIQFLDADDILLPAKVARCMDIFAAAPETGLVYCVYERRTADMRERHALQPDWAMPEGLILRELVSKLGPYFVPSCVLVRRAAFDSIGGFDEQMLTSEDWEFYVRLAAQGVSFRCAHEVLVWYRDTPGSMGKKAINIEIYRLRSYESLRKIPAVAEVADWDAMLATRYHVLALRYWRVGQAREARKYFRRAMALQTPGRRARRLLIALSYVTSARIGERIVTRLTKHRPPPGDEGK
jgi:glycosyltransferase involved in cell wall biosynthesis